MTLIHFTQPNTQFSGAYSVPHRMVDETRAFLAERGYVVYREVVR